MATCDVRGCATPAAWYIEGAYVCAFHGNYRRTDERTNAGEPGRDVERGDSAGLAGLEGKAGEPAAASRLDANPEPASEVGRARTGLTAAERDAIADACDAAYDFGDAWVRMLRNGLEDMLLPVVERIAAERASEVSA